MAVCTDFVISSCKESIAKVKSFRDNNTFNRIVVLLLQESLEHRNLLTSVLS